MAELRILRGEIAVGYPSGPSVVTGVLKREKGRQKGQRRCEDRGKVGVMLLQVLKMEEGATRQGMEAAKAQGQVSPGTSRRKVALLIRDLGLAH